MMMKTLKIRQWLICLVLLGSLFFPLMASGADHLVDHSENIPCVLWCRGCTPTSASMVLGYWDRGDAGWEWYGYGKLHDFWREYSKRSDGSGPIINVPNVVEELRVAMGTSVAGSTSGGDIGPGVTHVCNTINGYSFSSSGRTCGNSNDWCWGTITSEIDDNRPCLWGAGYYPAAGGSVGHTLAAWGYTDAKYVITYNTWQCPGRDDWYYKKYNNGVSLDFARLDTVVPGGGTWGQTSLTWPDGGEVLTAGKSYNITWHEFDDRTWSADLSYSTNAGASWVFIDGVEPSAPGWKTYAWTVPTLSSTSARVKIKNFSGSAAAGWVYQAGDGSEANFTIQEDHSAPTPNPMYFSSIPYEVSTSEIRMTATTASDSFTPLEYYFQFYSSPSGGYGGTNSSWQTDRTYSDTGLSANHRYGYRVKVRDGSPAHNETAYSYVSYDYTDIQIPTGITYDTITINSIACRSTNTPWGLTRGSSGLWLECYLNDNSGWKTDNNSWIQSGLSVNTGYWFRAKARNGDANETGFCDYDNCYTLANVLAAPSVTNPMLTTLDVTINANGNPTHTECMIYVYDYGSSSSFYLDASGGHSTTGVWQRIYEWGTVTATGLSLGTHYCFWVMARNGEGVNTSWSPSGCGDTQERSIIVTAPNGGESWPVGGSKTVTWKSRYVTGNVKIEISRNSGSTWSTVTGTTTNDGSYAWSVTAPTSKSCLVRVTSISYPKVGDTSDANFSITPFVSPCFGDFDGDGDVDEDDLVVLAVAFGSLIGDVNYSSLCDFDGDGDVDGVDLAVFAADFGRTDCP